MIQGAAMLTVVQRGSLLFIKASETRAVSATKP